MNLLYRNFYEFDTLSVSICSLKIVIFGVEGYFLSKDFWPANLLTFYLKTFKCGNNRLWCFLKILAFFLNLATFENFGKFCARKIWGVFLLGKILYREDSVLGRFCPGKILGIYLLAKILYREDFVPGRFFTGKILSREEFGCVFT